MSDPSIAGRLGECRALPHLLYWRLRAFHASPAPLPLALVLLWTLTARPFQTVPCHGILVGSLRDCCTLDARPESQTASRHRRVGRRRLARQRVMWRGVKQPRRRPTRQWTLSPTVQEQQPGHAVCHAGRGRFGPRLKSPPNAKPHTHARRRGEESSMETRPRKAYTVAEAEVALGVSEWLIRDLCRTRQLR